MTMKDIINKHLGIHSHGEAIQRGIEAGLKEKEESKKPETEEWIWVDGFKGTDSNMCCRGEQFEIGKTYSMPEDAEIKTCSSGYHLCLKLEDVFGYYEIKNNNRFFKVMALVRKSDYENYSSDPHLRAFMPNFNVDAYGNVRATYSKYNDKLAAKSIVFVSELTVDEILAGYDVVDWTEEQKKEALRVGPGEVQEKINRENRIDRLIECGYSLPFATYICEDNYRYSIAVAVGSQPDLSMDVKVMTIMLEND